LHGEVKVSRLSLRGQLILNTLWFGLNAQSSALLPIVIPTQIVLFISSNQVGSAQQVLFMIRSNTGVYYIVTACLVLVSVLVTVFGVREIPLMRRKHELVIEKEKTLLEFIQRFLKNWIEP